MSLYNRAASVVCPSVRPSVNFCANRFFSRAKGGIATKLAHDGLQVSVHPECAQSQSQRSRDTGTFVLARKSLLLAGKWPDRHQTCSRWSPGKRGPNFGFAYFAGTVIRRQSAIVPLDTQLASSYSHLPSDTFSLIRTVLPQFMRYRQTDVTTSCDNSSI